MFKDTDIEYVSTFPKQGKQGLVGLVQIKDTGQKVIFKISQYINNLVEHEYTILQGLSSIAEYCPHFCKSVGKLCMDVNAKYKKYGNPFLPGSNCVEKDVLLMEYIDDANKMCAYIENIHIPDYIIINMIRQVLMGVLIAQRKRKFTHYDLHSDNILIRKCDTNLVNLYIIDENRYFLTPTYGCQPVIIDYGFSYIQDMEDDVLWPSMGHTTAGFMSDRFDWVADPKLLLASVSKEMRESRDSITSKKFRRIVKNILHPLKMDMDSGWDVYKDDMSASDYVSEVLQDCNTVSKLFDKYEHYCLDIIQTLIYLPLEDTNTDNIQLGYKTFLKEFVKIENQVNNSFYTLYILKHIVNSARSVRADYLEVETRPEALRIFREDVWMCIDKYVKFCRPDKINFERMLCALYITANGMEGIMYQHMKLRMKGKQVEYNKLPVQSIEEMFDVITCNINIPYKFTKDTQFQVIDCINEKSSIIPIQEDDIDVLNTNSGLDKVEYIRNKYII